MNKVAVAGVGVLALLASPGTVAAQAPPTFPTYEWNGVVFDFTRQVWQDGEERQAIIGTSTLTAEDCQREPGAGDVFLTYTQDVAAPQGSSIGVPAPPDAPVEFAFTEPLHDDIVPSGLVGADAAADTCGFVVGPAPGAVESGAVLVDASAPPSLLGPADGWAYAVRLEGDTEPAPITSSAQVLAGLDQDLLLAYPIGPGGTSFTLACTVSGTDGDDVLEGTGGDDVICGGAGNDSLTGGGGNDALLGGPGDDELTAGAGDDLVVGDYGDDVLSGDEGADTLFGGWGVTPTAYPDFFAADPAMPSDGDDSVGGGPGDDSVVGGYGLDRLDGGEGDDRLIGGFGTDDMAAGPGANTCQEEAELAADC